MSVSTSSPIHFFFEKKIALSNRIYLKGYLSSILKREKRKLEYVNFIFTSDRHVLEVNRKYLQHDYYTDIITFELSSPGQPIQSDIYISVDRVRDNAKKNNVSIRQELHRVLFHGVLHLCGYKDKNKKDIAVMRKKERQYLEKYFN